MRIAFVDFAAWDYTVESPLVEPLGGSQSALCFLVKELAQFGHEIYLLNGTTRPGVLGGVNHFDVRSTAAGKALSECDAVVLQNVVKPASELRPAMRPGARLILWTQHAHDQPAMQPLRAANVRESFDAFALVSNWQQQCYRDQFALDPARCRVLRNAPGPPFAQLFADGRQAAAAKAWPPVLAYTSTPFRGLDLLLDLFPAVRRAVPGTQLQVFSSMQVYRVPAANDSADYGHLYRQCLETEGVEYVGSLPQADLAEALRSVTLLAYPNHFAETSCIAVMEALAAGLRVVTSRLGALPETLGGFGTLVPVDANWPAYRQRFATEVIGRLESIAARPDEAQEHLCRQIDFSRQAGSWQQRACEWSEWLSDLTDEQPT